MEEGDKHGISVILRDYKTNQGLIMYEKILSIPVNDRIPKLAENNFPKMITVIAAALTLAFEGMNLKRGITAAQTVDLAEAIIDTSSEDNLALEDLMLFLQKLVRGEYGAMYESMDIPKFMTEFDKYRDNRWIALNNIRYDLSVQYKSMGDMGRTQEPNELSEHFSNFANKVSEMSSSIKDLKKENQTLKNVDKF